MAIRCHAAASRSGAWLLTACPAPCVRAPMRRRLPCCWRRWTQRSVVRGFPWPGARLRRDRGVRLDWWHAGRPLGWRTSSRTSGDGSGSVQARVRPMCRHPPTSLRSLFGESRASSSRLFFVQGVAVCRAARLHKVAPLGPVAPRGLQEKARTWRAWSGADSHVLCESRVALCFMPPGAARAPAWWRPVRPAGGRPAG